MYPFHRSSKAKRCIRSRLQTRRPGLRCLPLRRPPDQSRALDNTSSHLQHYPWIMYKIPVLSHVLATDAASVHLRAPAMPRPLSTPAPGTAPALLAAAPDKLPAAACSRPRLGLRPHVHGLNTLNLWRHSSGAGAAQQRVADPRGAPCYCCCHRCGYNPRGAKKPPHIPPLPRCLLRCCSSAMTSSSRCTRRISCPISSCCSRFSTRSRCTAGHRQGKKSVQQRKGAVLQSVAPRKAVVLGHFHRLCVLVCRRVLVCILAIIVCTAVARWGKVSVQFEGHVHRRPSLPLVLCLLAPIWLAVPAPPSPSSLSLSAGYGRTQT